MKRNFAIPLPYGARVVIKGRVQECLDLIAPAGALLDIGCSSGWLAEPILQRGVRRYVGLDRTVSPADLSDRRVRLVSGSALQLPLAEGTFDAVCLFDVIEHLPRHSELLALQEARRVMRDDGVLYFSTPHASWPHTTLDPLWYFGHRHYRTSTIVGLLDQAGFDIQRIFVAGGIAELLDHVMLLVWKHVLRRQKPTVKLLDRLIERSHRRSRHVGATLFAVARPKGHAAGGEVTVASAVSTSPRPGRLSL